MKNNDATLHIRLEMNLKKELEKYADIYGIKLSNLIRTALEEFVYKDHEITTKVVPKINMENF